MLVEDDNSLREIYEARLVAEGYSVVAAKDGEEALAMALKERPDLIIADVMMPKVSGFDMLDILRSTPETKHTKIIMMTALSQAEDKARAEKLGADRYLVKSQVTLEDVTREARTILSQLEAEAAATVARAGTTAENHDPAIQKLAQNQSSTIYRNKAIENPSPATQKTTSIPVVSAPNVPDISKSTNDNKESIKPLSSQQDQKSSTLITSMPVPPIDTESSESKSKNKQSTDNDIAIAEPLQTEAEKISIPVRKEEEDVEEQIDEFISSNPTLSTSAEPIESNTDKEKSRVTASAAVDSLTKSNNQATKQGNPEHRYEDTKRSYVNNNSSNIEQPESSLEHSKRIEPLTDPRTLNAKPDLGTLLAKEKGSMNDNQAPPVNSVISPNAFDNEIPKNN